MHQLKHKYALSEMISEFLATIKLLLYHLHNELIYLISSDNRHGVEKIRGSTSQ